MQFEELEKIIDSDPELSAHKDYILAITKPSVSITISTHGAKDDESRFGGSPIAPTGFIWPSHPMGIYKFLGQINFSEIADRPASLPNSGILSLFYAEDEEGEIFWGDDGYIVGFYWPVTSELAVVQNPTAKPRRTKKIALRGAIDLPRHEELRSDWPFNIEVLGTVFDVLPKDYMLGYPSHYSLAYDPTPEGDWCSLLTIDSYDQFHWCWHDGDKLMVFINTDKLRDRDFSHLKSDAG